MILYQTCVSHHFLLPIDSPQINTGIQRAPVIHWFPWIDFLLSLMLPLDLTPPLPHQQLWHWVRQLALNGWVWDKNATSTLTWVHECRWVLCLKWCICVKTMNFSTGKICEVFHGEKSTLNFGHGCGVLWSMLISCGVHPKWFFKIKVWWSLIGLSLKKYTCGMDNHKWERLCNFSPWYTNIVFIHW